MSRQRALKRTVTTLGGAPRSRNPSTPNDSSWSPMKRNPTVCGSLFPQNSNSSGKCVQEEDGIASKIDYVVKKFSSDMQKQKTELRAQKTDLELGRIRRVLLDNVNESVVYESIWALMESSLKQERQFLQPFASECLSFMKDLSPTVRKMEENYSDCELSLSQVQEENGALRKECEELRVPISIRCGEALGLTCKETSFTEENFRRVQNLACVSRKKLDEVQRELKDLERKYELVENSLHGERDLRERISKQNALLKQELTCMKEYSASSSSEKMHWRKRFQLSLLPVMDREADEKSRYGTMSAPSSPSVGATNNGLLGPLSPRSATSNLGDGRGFLWFGRRNSDSMPRAGVPIPSHTYGEVGRPTASKIE